MQAAGQQYSLVLGQHGGGWRARALRRFGSKARVSGAAATRRSVTCLAVVVVRQGEDTEGRSQAGEYSRSRAGVGVVVGTAAVRRQAGWGALPEGDDEAHQAERYARGRWGGVGVPTFYGRRHLGVPCARLD